jgi:folate receptor
MACCNSSTTFQFHLTNASWYGFNYDHCAPMSSKCLDRFRQELCLYECDPYLGPWIVKVNILLILFRISGMCQDHLHVFKDTSKKIRTERFYNIPLCKSDCDAWFDDCRDDYTCRDNWNKGFVWKNGKLIEEPSVHCITSVSDCLQSRHELVSTLRKMSNIQG